MAINTQTIRVDLNTGKTIPAAYAHQNDTNRQLTFTLYNNGVPYSPSSTTAKFAYKSPVVNGQYSVITGSQMATGTILENTVTVTLPAEYTAVSGTGLLTMILTTSGNTLRPVNIKFVVESSVDGDDVVLGASDWPDGLYDYMDDWLAENEPTEIANLKSDINRYHTNYRPVYNGVIPIRNTLIHENVIAGNTYKVTNVCNGVSSFSFSVADASGNTLEALGSVTANSTKYLTPSIDGEYLKFYRSVDSSDITVTVECLDDFYYKYEHPSKFSFKNDLDRQGVGLMKNTTVWNGSNSGDSYYGQDGSRYEINIGQTKKLHLYVDWQFTEAFGTDDGNTPQVLVNAFSDYAMAYIYSKNNYRVDSYGNVFRQSFVGFNRKNNFTSTQISPQSWFAFSGKDALWVQYIGSESTASIKFDTGKATLTEGGNSRDITISETATIKEVVDILDSDSSLSAGVNISGENTYANLMHDSSLDIPLVYTFKNDSNQDYTDNIRVYIPLAYDDTWHSLEMIVDVDNLKMWAAFDGYTLETDMGANVANTVINTVVIGSLYKGENSPFRFRNLEIDVGDFGSAEVITSCAPNHATQDYSQLKQLISDRNPRVVIFEGHGIIVGCDSDVDTTGMVYTDETMMATTTDRLENLFQYAETHGYKNVTVEQIIDWKINGTPLPKRSFAVTFDDFRLENYIDYDKRRPFARHNVKAGLAIITEYKELDDEITVNNETYTVKEAFDIITNAGWYMMSHTRNHYTSRNIAPSQKIETFKQDVLSADRVGVHSNVIVYPGSTGSTVDRSALKASDFTVGIDGTFQTYNAKGTPRFRLTRIDLGLRMDYENVIIALP